MIWDICFKIVLLGEGNEMRGGRHERSWASVDSWWSWVMGLWWFLTPFFLLLCVFENVRNIKLKIRRNIVSIPCLIQRNPLNGENFDNLVTGERTVQGHRNFYVIFQIISPTLLVWFENIQHKHSLFIYSTSFFIGKYLSCFKIELIWMLIVQIIWKTGFLKMKRWFS